jgi:hypothetical protein
VLAFGCWGAPQFLQNFEFGLTWVPQFSQYGMFGHFRYLWLSLYKFVQLFFCLFFSLGVLFCCGF